MDCPSSMGAGGITAFESGANPIGELSPYAGGPSKIPAPQRLSRMKVQ